MPEAAVLEEVQRDGLATSRDGVVAGVSALAAPVFDASGRLVLTLTAIGPSASFSTDPQGPLARALVQAGLLVSQRLGG
jgi:DNA-binding IclR family transcriptional regulator